MRLSMASARLTRCCWPRNGAPFGLVEVGGGSTTTPSTSRGAVRIVASRRPRRLPRDSSRKSLLRVRCSPRAPRRRQPSAAAIWLASDVRVVFSSSFRGT